MAAPVFAGKMVGDRADQLGIRQWRRTGWFIGAAGTLLASWRHQRPSLKPPTATRRSSSPAVEKFTWRLWTCAIPGLSIAGESSVAERPPICGSVGRAGRSAPAVARAVARKPLLGAGGAGLRVRGDSHTPAALFLPAAPPYPARRLARRALPASSAARGAGRCRLNV